MKTLLAFDLGTSGVKCSLYDKDGALIGAEYGTYDTYYPRDDFREQRPQDWIDRICEATRRLSAAHPETEICAIGVSGHSLGALPVDAEGRLLTPQIPIWSDARATAQAKAYFEKVDYRTWYETTGNGFPPELYSLFKILWIKENQPEVYAKTDKFIGTKDYVNLFLTGVVATDVSYASGCGAFDLRTRTYRPDYMEAAGVDFAKFPRILASHETVGTVTAEAAAALGIAKGIPVVAGGVDNACMSLGAGCFEEGDAYASLGSSAWVTFSVSEPLVDLDNGIYTWVHCVPGQYIPSAGIFASGSALAWVADTLFAQYDGADRFDRLNELAATAPAGANGVMFNPAMAGGSAYDKSPRIRGSLCNLSLGHTAADVARAVFEGIALHLRLTSGVLDRSGRMGDRLLLVGGGAKGAFARQVYADVFAKQVAVSRVKQDAASLGAAALGAVGCGLWSDFSPLRAIHREQDTVEPNAENVRVYAELAPYFQQMCDACSDLGDALGARVTAQ